MGFALNELSTNLDVLVRIDGNVVKIPIDPEIERSIQMDKPPGSSIDVLFYNCEWHIGFESNYEPVQKIGIPIGELLERFDAPGESASQEAETVVDMPEEDIEFDNKYFKDVETDFRGEVDGLLKNIKLSHLKTTASDRTN